MWYHQLVKARSLVLIPLLLALVVAVACGGDEETPAPQPTPVPQPTATPVPSTPTPRAVATPTPGPGASPVIQPTPTATKAAATPTPVPTATPRPAPTSAPTATAAPAVPTGTLKLAFGELGFQSMLPRQLIAFGKDPAVLVFDSLVGSDTRSGLLADRGIATEWTLAKDNLSWTFKLRKGIKFANGDALTAEDSKFSIEQIILPDSAAAFAGNLRLAIKSMELTDDYTLVVNTKGPTPFFPWDVSGVRGSEGMIIPSNHVKSVGEQSFGQKAFGSGPYKVASLSLGSSLVLEAWGEHWREGVPKYKQVQYLIVPEESTRIAMLATRQTDTSDVSRERVKSLRDQGYNVFIKEKADVAGCYYHQQWENVPIAKKEVREALNLAINRQELLDTLYSGQGSIVPMYPIGSFSFGAGGDATLKPYPYDPKKAKELLASVGESNMEISITSFPRQGYPELPRTVEAVAGYWQSIGVKVKIVPMDFGIYVQKRGNNELPGWSSCLSTPNRAAPAEILTIMNPLFRCNYRYTTMCTAEFDALLEKGFSSLDPEVVKKVIGDIHRYLYNNYSSIPLLELGNPFATQKAITSWDLGQDLYDFNTLYLTKRR